MGRENAANKPAVVLAAGVEATQLATVELSMQMAEQMLASAETDDSVKNLLLNKTIYIFPNLNPDATEQYVEKLRWERSGNAQPTDDDRDGRMFEDAFEDLNQDGLITLVRVQDLKGDYRISEIDPRIMVKADTAKGEKGTHKIISEGIDNDKDGLWNEDAEGGVNFNKNFSYNFPFFTVGSGEHPMSERESKAFADFMFGAQNVYAVFVLGPANTLTKPALSKPIQTEGNLNKPLEKDDAVNRRISALYQRYVPVPGAPEKGPSGGDVLQWAYFHYGRFSFSTPGWWVPTFHLATDATQADITAEEKENINFIKWTEHHEIIGTFVNWKKINHPDFPGQLAEVGGFAPYVKDTPPVRLLVPVAENHVQFLWAFASLMPQLELASIKTEKITGGTYRITVEIANTGTLPTHSAIGEKTQWVQKVKIGLELNSNQTMVTGAKTHLLEAIPGGGRAKVTWLVKGRGYVGIDLSSPTGGKQKKEIVLR